MSEGAYYVGIDWGGTRIKFGMVSEEGKIMEGKHVDTPSCSSAEEVVDLLITKVKEVIERSGDKLKGIGVGLTGVVDPSQGVVYLPGKIKSLEGYPVVKRLQESFQVPVRAQNDGILAMYAEKFGGAAQDVKWAVTLTIGTGIGSGVMLDGKILDDPRYMFGSQIGHFVMNTGNDQLCLTGARGTGEMSCSATALVLATRSGLQRGIPSTLSEKYFSDPFSIDFKTIMEKGVQENDPLCCDEFEHWKKQLGWLLVNAVHAYSPEVIILSGGATLASGYFLGDLQAHLNQSIFRYPKGIVVPIKISEVREYSGVLGAAMMVKKFLEEKR